MMLSAGPLIQHRSLDIDAEPDVPTYYVTTTRDYAPGTEQRIEGSLRAAIEWANGREGLDRIVFDLADDDAGHRYYKNDGGLDSNGKPVKNGTLTLANATHTTLADEDILDKDADHATSWWRIQTKATLAIADAVIIDGYSQDGARKNTSATEIDAVLRIEIDGSLAGGASGLDVSADGSTIQGLSVHSFRGRSSIVISGSENQIAGNFIGTDVSGTLAPSGLPNLGPAGRVGSYGVQIVGASNNWIGTNGDGVDDLTERNLISAFDWGVVLRTTSHNIIAGNFIGTDRTGSKALANWTGIGSLLDSHSNQIGTTFEDAGNEVQRNIISGNRSGIYLGAGGIDNAAINTVVAGNYIGLDVDGAKLGNSHLGVAVMMGAHDNTIGRNTIAYNGTHGQPGGGVVVVDLRAHVEGNRILENSIHSNEGLGIDLLGPGITWGITTNDASRAGLRPNNFQEYPELTSAMRSGNSTTVFGTLTSAPGATFVIELFANNVANQADAEGEIFIGSTTVTTDAEGVAQFDVTLDRDVTAGQFVTATATSVRNAEEVDALSVDGNGRQLLWDTSEFSTAIQVEESPNQRPVADAGDLYTIDEGSSLRLKASGSSDPDGDSLTFSWDVNGDGVFDDATGETPTLTWAQLTELGIDDDRQGIQVTVRVDDGNGGTADASALLKVENVAPVIAGFESTASSCSGHDGQEVSVFATFTDAGLLDTHTATVNWGDGTVTSGVVVEADGSGSVAAEHSYASGGIYTVTLTLEDDDLGADVATTAAVITGAGVNDGVLQIVGTDGKDRVTVNQQGNGLLKVHANFFEGKPFRTFDSAEIQAIQIVLCDGDDLASIAGNIDIPATINGGAGNDHLRGGRGDDVLIGGTGNDKLFGGRGHDLLDGGDGRDTLFRSSGKDRLRGSGRDVVVDTFAGEADQTSALDAVMAAWNDGFIPGTPD